MSIIDPVGLFYHDLPPADAARYAALLNPQHAGTMVQDVTHAAYAHVPSAYLLCTLDAAIPVATQRSMIDRAGKENFALVEEVDTAHSPMLNKPVEVAAFIERAVAAA